MRRRDTLRILKKELKLWKAEIIPWVQKQIKANKKTYVNYDHMRIKIGIDPTLSDLCKGLPKKSKFNPDPRSNVFDPDCKRCVMHDSAKYCCKEWQKMSNTKLWVTWMKHVPAFLKKMQKEIAKLEAQKFSR